MGKAKDSLAGYLKFLKAQPKGFSYSSKESSNTRNGTNAEKLKTLKKKYATCNKCPLSGLGRKNVVFGKGNPNASLVFVGEGPGRDEDRIGEPFVGRAGQLLTKIIEAIGVQREDVYITNVVKCRPPNNRAPLPTESSVCMNIILFSELNILKPQIICTLGATATCAILGDEARISRTRGIFHQIAETLVMPTYHPAYLLRNPQAKRVVWEDMKKIQKNFRTNNTQCHQQK